MVLDTNVVLDLFVYDDAFARPLKEALLAGALTAWVDRHTSRELELVLAYRSFALTAEAQQAVRERYGALTRVSDGEGAVELPPCRDRDDQKFLVLAARVGASWLVSKDKRVLSMGGGRRLPFDVLTPRRASLLLGAEVSPASRDGRD
ncbi:PIN domain-containing protein [Corallococcus terminator]|uniref:PIN domain-containing protein n=1 Tax=Corallococcus terminator TaxID=2316733 RepID=A0A3A8J725_9BACT|nr:PIN domain-containing protein [Corallococcus terminator]